ncbi:MAG: hypothetical protein QG591_90 [Planctomycetota bacterium]|nr:hypothetical protein [Planctomycetota bacterium]
MDGRAMSIRYVNIMMAIWQVVTSQNERMAIWQWDGGGVAAPSRTWGGGEYSPAHRLALLSY